MNPLEVPRNSQYWLDISKAPKDSIYGLLNLVGCRVYQEGTSAPVYLVHYNSYMKRTHSKRSLNAIFEEIKKGLGIDMKFLQENYKRLEPEMKKAVHYKPEGEKNVVCLNGSAHISTTKNKELSTCPRCLATDTKFWK